MIAQRPVYSVMIAAYNAEKYISQAVTSVLTQSFPSLELIIIDDGSNDRTGDICMGFAQVDPRVRLYKQRNAGLLMTRRKLLKSARATWGIFVDADDYWEPGILACIENERAETDFDLALISYREVNEKGRPIKNHNIGLLKKYKTAKKNPKEYLVEQLLTTQKYNSLWTKIFKIEHAEPNRDITRFENLRRAEDLLQSIPIVKNSQIIKYIPKVLVNYRKTTNSMTSNPTLLDLKDAIMVRESLFDLINQETKSFKHQVNQWSKYYLEVVTAFAMQIDCSESDVKKRDLLLRDCEENVYKKTKYCEAASTNTLYKTIIGTIRIKTTSTQQAP